LWLKQLKLITQLGDQADASDMERQGIAQSLNFIKQEFGLGFGMQNLQKQIVTRISPTRSMVRARLRCLRHHVNPTQWWSIRVNYAQSQSIQKVKGMKRLGVRLKPKLAPAEYQPIRARISYPADCTKDNSSTQQGKKQVESIRCDYSVTIVYQCIMPWISLIVVPATLS
jgi:hypothetical protein